MNPRIDWMKSGAEYVSEKERDRFLSTLAAIDFDTGNETRGGYGEWHQIGDGLTLPMSQGEGIKTMIRELRIPKASAVCYDVWAGRYCILGVRGTYRLPDKTPHTVEVFAIDYGCGIAVACARVYEREVAA